MVLKPLPKMEIVEAFMEVAREADFRLAAARCGVSQMALSRRIQAFTQFVGCPVFEKSPEGMTLTVAGREYLSVLEPTYNGLKRAVASLSAPAADRTVALSISRSLSANWLAPRLELVRDLHPGLEVEIKMNANADLVRSGTVAFGICAGDVDTSGLYTEPLLDVLVMPVSSPQTACMLASDSDALGKLRRLVTRQQPDVWSWWSTETGAQIPQAETIMQYGDVCELYDAAAAGMGIALGASLTVQPYLQSGRLVALALPAVQLKGFYKLVTREDRPLYDASWALATWLRNQAAVDNHGAHIISDRDQPGAITPTG